MIQTVNFQTFTDAFRRFDRYEQLGGYDGLRCLFDFLEDLEDGTGQPIELDVIALCCDWQQFDSVQEAYDACLGPVEDDVVLTEVDMLEALRCYTIVLEYDGGVLVQQF
jgi:hypothetical protein